MKTLNQNKRINLKTVITTCVLGITLFSSCKKEELDSSKPMGTSQNNSSTSAKKADASFGFITVGNEWKYAVTTSGGNTDTSISFMVEMKTKITHDLGDGFYNEDVSASITDEGRSIKIYTAKGHRDANGWSEVDNKGNLSYFLSANPAIGELTFKIVNNDTMFFKVVALDENITVPAGNFSCVKVHNYNSQNTVIGDCFYSLTKGLIKSNQNADNGEFNVNIKMELTGINFN